MKRLFFYFLSAIALLSGCEKAEDVGLPNQDNIIVSGDASSTTLPEVLYAFIDGEDAQDGNLKTRTYIDNTNKIVWHRGDSISYFTGTTHNAKYVSNEADGSENAVFTLDESVQAGEGDAVNKSYAVYPYNANTSVVRINGTDVIKVNFPTTQISSSDPKTEKSFGKGSNIMVATGEIGNNELLFRNACGYLIIKLDSPQENIQPIIQSIKLTARGGEKIAGNANITIGEDGIPSVTMIDDASASSTITINCNNVTYENVGKKGVLLTGDDKAEFWFALPPVTLSQGIRIEVDAVAADNHQLKFVKETNNVITIKRNIPQPMASLNFESHYALRYTRSNGNNASGKELTFADGAFKSGENNASITSHYFDSSLGCFVINLAAPLTAIGSNAFKGKDITSITLPESLTTIGTAAFASTPLTEITIPGSVTTIGMSAFYGCTALATLSFEESDTPLELRAQEDNKPPFYNSPLARIDFVRKINYMKSDGTEYTYKERVNNQHSVKGQGLFAIAYETRQAMTGVTTVTIGEAITEIPCNAFEYLPITSLTIPGTVTTIGNDAFFECDKLAELTLAPSPTNTPLTVGQDTDGGNKEGLFAYCPLVTINFNRQVEYSFTYDDVKGKAGIFSFYDSGYIPKDKTTTITIGDQVKIIPIAAFAYANITEIKIPKTVTYISKYAFYKCEKLGKVILGHNGTQSPHFPRLQNETVFEGSLIPTSGCIVVESESLAETLKLTAYWQDYSKRITVSNSGN